MNNFVTGKSGEEGRGGGYVKRREDN